MPHAELQAPKDAMAEYEGQFEEPYPVVDNQHLTPQPKPRTAMAAMISRVDRDVGRLLDYLEDSGLAEDTLVFFTSDNGASDMGHDGSDLEFFEGNGPLRGHKRDLYEGGIRVPMIAWWPGKVPAGRVSDFAWASWDVFPTVVDLAGGKVDEELPVDGQSVVPMLLGQPQKPKFPLYWEVGSESRLKQAVRDGNWKAVRLEPGGPVELYDLSEDLSETHDVSEQHPEVVAKLTAVMDATHTPQRTYPPEPVLYDKKPEDTGFVR
jgi:arylsulfatase A-like enzyme